MTAMDGLDFEPTKRYVLNFVLTTPGVAIITIVAILFCYFVFFMRNSSSSDSRGPILPSIYIWPASHQLRVEMQ